MRSSCAGHPVSGKIRYKDFQTRPEDSVLDLRGSTDASSDAARVWLEVDAPTCMFMHQKISYALAII